MGGKLMAESAEERGSTFTFKAPLRRPVEDAPTIQPVLAAPQVHGRLRILAAEDNLINQLVLTAMLEPLDVELVMTADGDAAVAAYKAGGFDLVLMDIQMPKLGGVAATREIRAWETLRGLDRTPIVAVTANVMTHQIGAYLAAGMDTVISKPLDAVKLFEAIEGALPMQRAA
jgi:CheY-like chemotaxis protein